MTTLSHWLENAKETEGMHMLLRKDPSSGKVGDHISWLYLRGVDVTRLQFCITLVLFYNGSEEEGRENYKKFYALSKSSNEIRLDRTDQDLGDQNLFSMARKRFLLKNSIHLFVFRLCLSTHILMLPIQNNAHPRGMCAYIKSAFQSKPTFSVVNHLLEKLTELNAAPGNEIEHGYGFELFPKNAILSRSEDATAHVRDHRYTTGCIITWMNNTPSVEQAAKQAAHELTDIVAKAEGTETNSGYGNFSEHLYLFEFRSHSTYIVFHRF